MPNWDISFLQRLGFDKAKTSPGDGSEQAVAASYNADALKGQGWSVEFRGPSGFSAGADLIKDDKKVSLSGPELIKYMLGADTPNGLPAPAAKKVGGAVDHDIYFNDVGGKGEVKVLNRNGSFAKLGDATATLLKKDPTIIVFAEFARWGESVKNDLENLILDENLEGIVAAAAPEIQEDLESVLLKLDEALFKSSWRANKYKGIVAKMASGELGKVFINGIRAETVLPETLLSSWQRILTSQGLTRPKDAADKVKLTADVDDDGQPEHEGQLAIDDFYSNVLYKMLDAGDAGDAGDIDAADALNLEKAFKLLSSGFGFFQAAYSAQGNEAFTVFIDSLPYKKLAGVTATGYVMPTLDNKNIHLQAATQQFRAILMPGPAGGSTVSEDLDVLRKFIGSYLLTEELTRTDKRDIKRMAKKEITSYFEAQIQKQLDKHWTKKDSKFDKYVNDKITKRFRDASKDSDFDDAVIKVSKRVIKALHDLHYKRSNLIDNMPVRK